MARGPCTHTLGAPGAIRCADCQSEDARRALAATICRSCGLAGHLGECDLGWMRRA